MSAEALYPDTPQKLAALGRSAADLLAGATGPGWILRRKEKVTLLDDTAVNRQMSVDFLLPSTVPPLGSVVGEDVYYAPLFFLPKGMDSRYDPRRAPQPPEPLFANFDLRDESGRALSLPPRHWNGLVTTQFLLILITNSLESLGLFDPEASVGIADIARQICMSEVLLADVRLEELRNSSGAPGETKARRLISKAQREDDQLARMLEICAGASVAMTPLIGGRTRQGIVKLSFDEQVSDVRPKKRLRRASFAALSWSGYELWIETPYIGAASYHFEFEAPTGLEIYDAGLLRIDGPIPTRPNPSAEAILDGCSGTSRVSTCTSEPPLDL